MGFFGNGCTAMTTCIPALIMAVLPFCLRVRPLLPHKRKYLSQNDIRALQFIPVGAACMASLRNRSERLMGLRPLFMLIWLHIPPRVVFRSRLSCTPRFSIGSNTHEIRHLLLYFRSLQGYIAPYHGPSLRPPTAKSPQYQGIWAVLYRIRSDQRSGQWSEHRNGIPVQFSMQISQNWERFILYLGTILA